MFSRTRFQVRHSTVLVIVLILMGSVLYEVTRTEAIGRQSAARTQDINLAAPQAIEHKIKLDARPDYIGRTSTLVTKSNPVSFDGDVALPVGTAAASARGLAMRNEAAGSAGAAPFGRSVANRVRSANSSGYAAGSYGMSGVGAWGGVSGMVRPQATRAAAAPRAAKAQAPKAAKPPATKRPGSGGGSTSTDAVVATQFLPGGFTTGAAAVQSGAVAAVQGSDLSPGASPASTPEPMSVLLMGTGLMALYGVRRRFQ